MTMQNGKGNNEQERGKGRRGIPIKKKVFISTGIMGLSFVYIYFRVLLLLIVFSMWVFLFCVYYYYSHGLGVNHTHEKKRLISDESKKSILYKNQTIYNDFCFETIKMKRLVGSNLGKKQKKSGFSYLHTPCIIQSPKVDSGIFF